MPRVGDPRVAVRMTPEDLASIQAAANLANVAVGALIRESALRYGSTVAAELRAGGKRVRRQRVEERPVGSLGAENPAAVAVRARRLGVDPAALARQAKLNDAKAKTR